MHSIEPEELETQAENIPVKPSDLSYHISSILHDLGILGTVEIRDRPSNEERNTVTIKTSDNREIEVLRSIKEMIQ